MGSIGRNLASAAAVAAWILAAFAGSAGARSGPALCERLKFEATDHVVCTLDPAKADLRLYWQDAAGRPYRRFSNLAQALAGEGLDLVFAMNAGMYSETFVPVGLHVENGRELHPLDTSGRKGPAASIPNFYKKPNGVFLLDADGAHVLSTEAYMQRRARAGQGEPRLATQSGPMLVIGGQLHPAFIPGSSDRTKRSGVGVCEGGLVRFAISDGEVNFHDFARLFRDELKCPNALFLDGGNGAGLYDPAMRRNDTSWHGGYGPFFAVVEKTGAR